MIVQKLRRVCHFVVSCNAAFCLFVFSSSHVLHMFFSLLAIFIRKRSKNESYVTSIRQKTNPQCTPNFILFVSFVKNSWFISAFLEVLSESYNRGKQKPLSLVPCRKVLNYFLATSWQFLFIFSVEDCILSLKRTLKCANRNLLYFGSMALSVPYVLFT
jgi:hypothetical protein